MEYSNNLHSFTWQDRSSTKLSSFDASLNEHILDLVSVPGPHVTEHEPDHSPHSLKNILNSFFKERSPESLPLKFTDLKPSSIVNRALIAPDEVFSGMNP